MPQGGEVRVILLLGLPICCLLCTRASDTVPSTTLTLTSPLRLLHPKMVVLVVVVLDEPLQVKCALHPIIRIVLVSL